MCKTIFANWENYKVSWNLFGVHYWFLKLYTKIIWHSCFLSHGILLRKDSSRSGAKWVKNKHNNADFPQDFCAVILNWLLLHFA